MKIVNPNYKIFDSEKNIFTIRKKEYENLLPDVELILKPVADLGFKIKELEIKETRHSSSELQGTIKQKLVILLEKNNKEVDLSFVIPKLVLNNYIVINGKKKVPIYQLYDIPSITRGSIKIKTNVASIILSENKNTSHIMVSFLKKKVKLSHLILAYYGREKTSELFDLKNLNKKEESNNEILNQLTKDIKEIYDESKNEKSMDDRIKAIGKKYTKYNTLQKGLDILYALDIILKVDIIAARFFNSNCILEEFLKLISIGKVDDLNLINKRLRCTEYMILSKISKSVFDLCISNRRLNEPKFNVNSSLILSECNVSDVIQFDFSINPIQELTYLTRTSLAGPGGFTRQNVPEHLRDIYDSMFGRICPVDTPDRENCGVLQNVVPNVDLDENLKFTDKIKDKCPISIPVTMVPFLEHDDQTRLQMASSQMRQAIMLNKFDNPLIQSGCEGLYTKFTQFIKIAKKAGEVVHRDSKYIIVLYSDGSPDIFDISIRPIYTDNFDFMKIYVEQGDTFKAGDILAESNFCSNGNINIGKNLLTGVMSYYGYNYEDGIVISDRLVKEGVLTSIHHKNLSFFLSPNKVLISIDNDKYRPLPEPNLDKKKIIKISPNTIYAIIKEIPEGPINYYSIFGDSNALVEKEAISIIEVNIYANSWYANPTAERAPEGGRPGIQEFNNWINHKIDHQQEREAHLRGLINDFLPKKEAELFIKQNCLHKFSRSNLGKYKIKGEKINGMFIEILGAYKRPIKVGDKIGNRHGNKGVISKIVPQNKMPKLKDGRVLDICINPLGIISRMNIGQLFELHLGSSLEDFKIQAHKILSKSGQKDVKKYILDYVNIIDNTKTKWYGRQVEESLPLKIDKQFIDNFVIIQAPFESITMKQIKKALEYTNTLFEEKVFDPILKDYLLNTISVGPMYFFKMVHIAENRLAARGIGSYSKKTLQPLSGRKHGGGQRCGEMETSCLIGHDGLKNLKEFFTTKSDSIDLKNKYIRDLIETDMLKEQKQLDDVPESVKLLEIYLKVMGFSMD